MLIAVYSRMHFYDDGKGNVFLFSARVLALAPRREERMLFSKLGKKTQGRE